jgi:hypothetical protein
MTPTLPDPRTYGLAPQPGWLAAAGDDEARLIEVLRSRARAAADDEISAALRSAPDAMSYRRLWRALCAALEKPAASAAVAPRLFAIPWVIVCGARAPARIECVLPDVGELTRVLEARGVFGPSRNLGFSNALSSIEALEALPPGALLRAAEEPEALALAPAPIVVKRGSEEVHVRFLVGASIAPEHAPDIVTTGANIGAWGTPALRAMAAQLRTPGVDILPLPRPPAGLYSAAYAGRRAGVEAAFNLFTSNTVREFRSTVGDPEVTLSSHSGGELRVTLSTPFDDARVEGFRWPLHPSDDLAEVEATILRLLAECRLAALRLPAILPDLTAGGAVMFPGR